MEIKNELKINYKQLSEEIKEDFLKEAKEAGFTEKQAEFLYMRNVEGVFLILFRKMKKEKKIEERINRILNEEDGFLVLTQEMKAREWHDRVNYYLKKIKEHEFNLKHKVQLWGVKNTDFKTGQIEYKKVWICDDCGEVFLKVRYNPEILKIKEFYQMCFDGKLPDLAEEGIKYQINQLKS